MPNKNSTLTYRWFQEVWNNSRKAAIDDLMARQAEWGILLAPEEARRLGELDLSKQRESLRAAEEAKAALAKKDVSAAEESIKKAQDLWSENELLVRLNQELTTAKETASAETTAASNEKSAEETAAQKAADKPPTAPEGTEGAPAAASDDEEKPSNPVFRIIIALVLAGVAYAGWKAYSSVRKKANEVVE